MTGIRLKTAVIFWYDKEEEVLQKYGHISNWNVQNITDQHIQIVDEKVSSKEKEIMTI